MVWMPAALITVQEAQVNSIEASDRSRSRILEIEKELGTISKKLSIRCGTKKYQNSNEICFNKKLSILVQTFTVFE